MDGFAGFRPGQDCEFEVGTTQADDERPAAVVPVNPVSKAWMYYRKSGFAQHGEKP